MHYHHQNLDTRPGDGWSASGQLWRHGRAWLHFGKGSVLNWEWALLRGVRCSVGVHCSDESGLTFNLSLPLLGSLYVSLYLAPLRDWYCRHDWKDLSVSIHDWAIWVHLWADESACRFHGPFWHPERRRLTWHPVDTLLGPLKHQEPVTLRKEPITVTMPEGTYHGTCELQIEQWKRKRWPWWPSAKRVERAHIEMHDPIPKPGKGENSWDCGEDATHGMTCPAESIPEAIGTITQSVLRDRHRYGGRS